MNRIIIDCNVLISAGLTNGTCRKLVINAVSKHKILLSKEIAAEYKTVIKKPKFKKLYHTLLEMVNIIIEDSDYVSIDNVDSPILPDRNDEIYLKTAMIAKADFLITGNIKDFQTTVNLPFSVVTPSQFINTQD